ncbi:MAG TPA: endolytic transglycosylase MltG, partial [Streptosporangiaceae bacterium]
ETPLQILKAMVTEFNQKTAGINLAAAAKQNYTTPWHVLIVASMVQAEAGSNADMGKIARVAWNRLGKGMKLGFDSTVFYGLNTYGTAATYAQIHKPTPYNTYMNLGLPPGPIGNPGMTAIEAALHPPHGGWTYFITDLRHKPSVTYFTSSYAQFKLWYQQFNG